MQIFLKTTDKTNKTKIKDRKKKQKQQQQQQQRKKLHGSCTVSLLVLRNATFQINNNPDIIIFNVFIAPVKR